MPAQQNRVRDDATTAIHFPIRLLTIALVLTTAAFAWFGWVIFDLSRDAKNARNQSTRMEELRGVIVHLDAMLTMSARLGVATGDPKWEEQHRRFKPQLEAAIQEVKRFAAHPASARAAAETDEANIKIAEMESRAFALVRAGRMAEAHAVVFGSEYEREEQIYARGIALFMDQVRREAVELERQDKDVDFLSLIGALVVLAISFAAWLSVVRGLQRWRTDLEEAVNKRKQAENALQRAHDELEVRIEQRTAELGKTNQSLQAEITERGLADKALRESEARYRALFAESADGIVIVDLETRAIKYANPALCRMLGYAEDELQTMSVPDIHRQDALPGVVAEFEAQARGDKTLAADIPCLRKDGSVFYADINAVKITIDGRLCIGGFFRDITERKRTEESLRLLGSAVEQANESLVITDAELDFPGPRIIFVNPAYTKMTGYSAEEAIGKTPRISQGPRTDKTVLRRLRQNLERGEAFQGEVINYRKDGTEYTQEFQIAPVRDASGKITHFVAIRRDITERKLAVASLRASEERFRIAAETANDVIYEWDLKQSVEWMGKIDEILGYEPGEFPRTLDGWAASVHPEDLDRTMAAIQAHLEGRGPYASEYRVRRKDGVYRWWSARGAVARAPDGKPTRLIGSVTDITERKQAEQALRQSEEHFHFLDDLAGATRTLVASEQIMAVTSRMLGEHLRASRCAYADVRQNGEQFIILHDYTDGCASTVGHYRLSLFGARAVATLQGGDTLIVRNVKEELLPGEGADMFNAIGIQAVIVCPQIKDGVLRAMMAVHQTTPRDWMPGEIALVQEVVERCWATIGRRTAEENLRESDEKFRQLAANVADVFYMTSPDLQQMHYVSPAYEQIWGRSVESLYANPRQWGEAILPEERADAFAVLSRLTADEPSVSAEFRIARPDGTVRWILSRGFQVRDVAGKVVRITGIASDITGRKRSEAALEKAHQELVKASRQAGMAEFATGVLHNVGNVMNSVNVATTCLSESLRKSKSDNLSKVVALLRLHEADLGAFFTHNPKGKQIPAFLAKLAEHLVAEQAAALKELGELQKNIEHIRGIITVQQNSATMSHSPELFKVADLVEEALKMNENGLRRSGIDVIKEFGDIPSLRTQKHLVLQILINLVRNAMQACEASAIHNRKLTIRTSNGKDRVRIAVSDNGVGILAENLVHIFSHGFTTKKDGHGFGLHSAALSANEMGGSLTVQSAGSGQGAAFTLELPCPKEQNAHE